MKLARHFVGTLIEGRPSPIDVYRAIEYALPGILAARSADLGGAPIAIPDLRRTPYTGTTFWETIGLPRNRPEACTVQAAPVNEHATAIRLRAYRAPAMDDPMPAYSPIELELLKTLSNPSWTKWHSLS